MRGAALAKGVDMDRRTEMSKIFGKVMAEGMEKHEKELPGIQARMRYIAADRCRICRGGRSDLPHAVEVRLIVDEALMRNSTYEGAAVAAQHLVMEWPEDERPNYAAVRNHARRHLKRDDAFARAILEKHAADAGVDIETDGGSILTPSGMMALTMEKTYEGLQDGSLRPTLAEGLKAGAALEAAQSQRLRSQLDEAQQRIRLLSSVVQSEPEALTALKDEEDYGATDGAASPPLPARHRSGPSPADNDAHGPFKCGICGLEAKTKGGLSQHRNRKHRGLGEP